ncbi:MAG: hypothetical protein H0W15_04150 [Gemmatimonadales bacterium]|nr:hypothetical protein [Gemmatimonadales bacterium]
MDEEEPELIMSRHCQAVRQDGCEVKVHIYRDAHTDWTLEVEDEAGGSTVWDDKFATDDLALREFQDTLAREGISVFQVPSA